ncbi:MAG: efflux RND transporter periplasmic adaptor subunit [Gammaproteobacteria bacterium]|nr:efflux RND transporter periplasmic adaptor subunit [Gammaproteobacteria bacterium]
MKKIVIAIAVLAVVILGWWIAEYSAKPGSESVQETALEHAEKHLDLVEVKQQAPKEKKILYWVAPMDPSYRRDEPGKSPMGMDLVPVYDEGDAGPEVKISPAVINNLGVRTARVERSQLWRRIDTVASVDYDESLLRHIHLRTDGWIEKLNVRSEGERVKKGDRLFNVYSPTLVNAMEEYVQAATARNRRLIKASQDRLLALGISNKQIKQLEATKQVPQTVEIYAQQDGVVASLYVREGMYVMPANEVMRLADLSSVWLLAEVFERQADWVRLGQTAEVTLSYLPGRQWEGKVEYIYPSLDPKTRTLKVRLQFDNPDEELKPNMYGHVSIYGGARKDILVLPREALIRTGLEQRVILALGDGRFIPRKVNAGMESRDWVEIISGVEEGDSVVTSGQFLIDSEASLKASLMRMDESAGTMDKEETTSMPVALAIIKKLMPEQSKINLQHEPIPELGWPAMTMDFELDKAVSLDGLNVGDRIQIKLMKGEDGYVISDIQSTSQQE